MGAPNDFSPLRAECIFKGKHVYLHYVLFHRNTETLQVVEFKI